MKRDRGVIIGMLFLCILLLIVKTVLENDVNTYGPEYSQIRQEIRSVDAQNNYLSEKVAAAEALTNIATKAAAMGFTQELKFYYVNGK